MFAGVQNAVWRGFSSRENKDPGFAGVFKKLNVEFEEQDVAVFHDVLFTFDAVFTRVFHGLLTFKRE